MNGGEALVDTLLALGVDTGFTVPGESFLTVLEALRRERDAFRLISTRHESGATFAADATAFSAVLQAAMDAEGPSLIHLITDQRDIVPGGPQDDVV